MSTFDWESVRVSVPPAGWVELEDSTWDALISARAGAGNVLRQVRDGSRFRADDQEVVDRTIDEYLGAAGIPPRPRGYAWFLRLPQGITNQRAFQQDLNTFITNSDPTASLPGDLSVLVSSFLQRSYS
ncbi:DUF5956 family protein [Arthrobacter sp. CAN_A212]|uniref:DUF5956 family protein n=1 Tax=Arthrobacter sp. CAN_A212 TaxID=2787719 RepID=UPI003FA4CAE3